MFAGLPLRLRLILAALALAIAAYALFGDAGEPLRLRSQHYLWDLGHVLLGAGLVLGLHLLHPPLNRRPDGQRLLLAAALGLAFGLVSEGLQSQVGRDASWRDLGLDLLGALLAELVQLAFQSSRRRTRRGSSLLAAVLLLALPWPWLAYRTDEAAQARDFPRLADGSQPWEAGRWRDAEPVKLPGEDNPALLACLPPHTLWAGTSLLYFPEDWRGYARLRYRAFLPGREPLPLVLRIEDEAHQRRGGHSADRYNGLLTLLPGWNRVELPLARVLETPGGRVLDAARIRHLRWFVPGRLGRQRCLYLDDVELLR